MTGQCQCDWHKLQYCWMCESDFDEHTESVIDSIDDEHAADTAYLAHLANMTDAAPLIELAENIRQDTTE